MQSSSCYQIPPSAVRPQQGSLSPASAKGQLILQNQSHHLAAASAEKCLFPFPKVCPGLWHPPPASPIIFHLFELPAEPQSPQLPRSPLQHCPIKYTLDPSITPKALFPPHDGYKQPQELLGHQQKLSDAHPSPHHQVRL